jgi:hypothetical protein
MVQVLLDYVQRSCGLWDLLDIADSVPWIRGTHPMPHREYTCVMYDTPSSPVIQLVRSRTKPNLSNCQSR